MLRAGRRPGAADHLGARLSEDLLAEATAALRGAADAPAQTVAAMTDLLDRAPQDAAEVVAVAHRALGMAHRELLDATAAEHHLRRSVAVAEAAGLGARAAEARLSLAAEHVNAGRPAAALRELGRAEASLGEDHPQLLSQLAMVYTRFGRFAQALVAADRALAAARAQGDASLEARFLGNRGLVHAYLGQLDDAERDLRDAQAAHRRLGEQLFAHDADHNLAWLLTRRGRLPEALELFDDAEAGVGALGVQLAPLLLDRAEALLAAGLATEAADVARTAAAELAEADRHSERAEALLVQARAELLAEHPAAAVTAATAADLLAGQDRVRWAALATGVAALARARSALAPLGGPPADAAGLTVLLVDLDDAAGALAGALDDVAADAVLAAGRVALALGDAEGARTRLAPLLARRRSPAPATRARGWQAAAVLAAPDRPATALRAAATCLDALDEQRAGLGALELHAGAALHAREVAQLGLALAARRGPTALLTWSDRARTTSLSHPAAVPPDDPALAADLEQLRTVALVRQAAELDEEPTAALARRQGALEEAVRRRTRHGRATGTSAYVPPNLDQLRTRLGDRSLVSLTDVGGRLLAVVLGGSGPRTLDLGPTGAAGSAADQLRLALRLACLGRPRRQAVDTAAAALDRLLGGSLRGSAGVVIAPTPELAAVPWSALPRLVGRDVEVTPSLALWARPVGAASGGPDVVVAGPGLAEAEAEAQEVARARPGARLLTGAEATSTAVLGALDGARVAHLACHGTFRGESPLFSSLLLADGPLTVHDLERVPRTPEAVVLSACDSGRGGDTAGHELLGLAAALFRRGTRTLVASTLPVHDGATRALMSRLHQAWAAGAAPATALRSAAEPDGGLLQATGQAFSCFTA